MIGRPSPLIINWILSKTKLKSKSSSTSDHQHSSRSCTIFLFILWFEHNIQSPYFSIGSEYFNTEWRLLPKNVNAPMSLVNLFHLPADRCLMIEQQAIDIERKCSCTCLVTIGSITTTPQDHETVLGLCQNLFIG